MNSTGTEVLILATVAVWVTWDFIVYIKRGTIATESWTIWKWSYYAPGVAFLVGILTGHLFFNMPPKTEVLSVPCLAGNR